MVRTESRPKLQSRVATKDKHASVGEKRHHALTLYQQLIWCGLLLLVSLLPIIINPLGYNMFASVRSAFLYVLVTAMIFSMLLDSLKKGEFCITKSPLDIAIVVFAVGIVASTSSSVHLSTSIFGQLWRYEGMLTWLSYFVVFFAVLYAIKTKRQQVWLLYALMFSALVISLYAISQHFRLDFIPWSPDQDLTRSISTLGGPTYLGAYLVLVIPLALVLASIRESPRGLRLLSLFSAIMMALALLYTFARSAWLALLVSLILLALVNLTTVLRKRYLTLLLIGLLVVSFFLLLSTGRLSPYIERAKSAFNLTRGSSGGIRLLAWQQTIEMIKDRPLLGWGPETYSLIFPRYITVEWEQTVRRDFPTDKAHNDLLQVASTMGLVSLVPYVLIFVLFFWNGLRSITRIQDPFQRNLLKGLSAGVLAYLAQLQFNFNVVDVTPIFWGFMGMAMSVSSIALNDGERTLRLPRLSSPHGLRFALAVSLLVVGAILIFAVKPIIADMHFRRGLEALQAGNPQQAVAELSSARAFDPKEPYYAQKLGQTYAKLLGATRDQSYFSEAIKTLNEAQRVNSLNEYTYLYLGDAYLTGAEVLKKPGLLALAVQNYRKLLTNDPNFAQAHLSLGIAYAQMNKTEKAVKEWKIVPNLYPAADSAYYNLGVAYEQMGKRAEALESFKKVLELNPSSQAAREAVNRLES